MLIKFPKVPAGVLAVAMLMAAGWAGVQPALAVAASPVSVPCSTTALSAALTGAVSGETIRLAAGCDYVLTAALPPVTVTLTIAGRGATLERSTAAGTPAFALLDVTTGDADLAVSNLTFSNGDGAINMNGFEPSADTLTVTRSTFTGNTGGALNVGGAYDTPQVAAAVTGSVFTGNTGGAINDNGVPLTVTRSTFTGNTASSDYSGLTGGGITMVTEVTGHDIETGAVTVTGSTFTSNTGSGIACVANDCPLTVTRSVFTRNTGSGISVSGSGGEVSVTHSTFRCNTTPGGGGGIDFSPYPSGDLTAADDVFTGNTATGYGGGIYNFETATVTGDTFTGNSAADGGAIANQGLMSVTRTAFRNNKASTYGGAVYQQNLFGNEGVGIGGGRITGNSADGDGGGVYNAGPGTGGAGVSPSTVVRNNQPDNCAPAGSVGHCTG
jgi:predicted outer membrane repeat protein